jgi:hypothetical protein
MHETSVSPTASACRPVWVAIPAGPPANDTSCFSACPPVRSANVPARTPRCPRRSVHPRRLLRRSHGSARRRGLGHLGGTPCRTGHRSGSRTIPSLSRVAPSVVSERFLEVLGSRQSPVPYHVLRCLQLGALPSTGITRLRRYYGPIRHPARPGLSLAGFRLAARAATKWGFPCCD